MIQLSFSIYITSIITIDTQHVVIQVCIYYNIVSLLTVTPCMEMTIIMFFKECGTLEFDPALNYDQAIFPSLSSHLVQLCVNCLPSKCVIYLYLHLVQPIEVWYLLDIFKSSLGELQIDNKLIRLYNTLILLSHDQNNEPDI